MSGRVPSAGASSGGVPGAGAFDLLVLAGGRGERLGGVSKADIVLAGRTLLDRVLDAASGARRFVVVGPPGLARPGVPTTLEEPASGGPVAGIDAGLTALGRDGDVPVLVLACDVPRAAEAAPALLAALAGDPGADLTHLVDQDGRAQRLVAAYRRSSLRAVLDALRAAGGVHGVSVRAMAAGLAGAGVPDPLGLAADVDTWQDAAHAEAALLDGRGRARTAGAAPDTSTKGRPMTGHDPHQAVGPELYRWVSLLVAELGVDPEAVDVDGVLDLAREAAAAVARPAVPLTGFLAGYAVAASGGGRGSFERVSARIAELAQAWAQPS